MKTETLEALKESCHHWHRLATGTQRAGEHSTTWDCALCGLFFNEAQLSICCEGCPVYADGRDPRCRGTPYEAAYEAWKNYVTAPAETVGTFRAAFFAAAQDELDFLLGLVPAAELPGLLEELGRGQVRQSFPLLTAQAAGPQ